MYHFYGPRAGTRREEIGAYYYALIDSVDEVNEKQVEIVFDSIDARWFDESINDESRLLEFYSKMPTHFFRAIFEKDYLDANKGLLRPYSRWGRKWILLKIGDVGGQPVDQITEANSESQPNTRFIEWIRFLSPYSRDALRLSAFFSWEHFTRYSYQDLKQVLSNVNKSSDDIHLNIYDVGQGSMSAICDENEIPLMYFDVGGGFAWNQHTYPNTKRLCWSKAEVIILSHWDKDHLETARRARNGNWSNFTNKTWIAPEQPLSPFYAGFAAHLANTGRLLIWPNAIRSIRGNNFKIIKCRGPHKNHSGLALVIDSIGNDIRRTLHPADASYMFITRSKKRILEGLVSTHHGANFLVNNAPLPLAIDGCIAYSFGAGNSYNHPRQESIDAHEYSGWGENNDFVKLTTVNQNISMQRPANYHFAGCANCNCDLQNLSYF